MRDGRGEVHEHPVPGYLYVARLYHTELFQRHWVFRIGDTTQEVWTLAFVITCSCRNMRAQARQEAAATLG